MFLNIHMRSWNIYVFSHFSDLSVITGSQRINWCLWWKTRLRCWWKWQWWWSWWSRWWWCWWWCFQAFCVKLVGSSYSWLNFVFDVQTQHKFLVWISLVVFSVFVFICAFCIGAYLYFCIYASSLGIDLMFKLNTNLYV